MVQPDLSDDLSEVGATALNPLQGTKNIKLRITTKNRQETQLWQRDRSRCAIFVNC